MKDSVRRMLLFFGIVAIGVILLFIDLPFLYLVVIVSIFGIFLLFVTGALSLKSLRRERDKTEEPATQERPTFGERFAEKAPSFYNLYKKLNRGGGKPKEKKEKKEGGLFGRKKKDDKEKAIPASSSGAIKATIGESIDDEPEEDDLFGDINLDDLDDEGLDDFGDNGAVIDMGQDDAYMADDVASILAQAGDLDDELPEGGFDQPLDAPIDDSFGDSLSDDLLSADGDLDAIDLDELETGDEEELPDEIEDLDEIEDPLADSPIEEEVSWEEKNKDQFSFGESAEAISSNVGFSDSTGKETKSSFFSKSGRGGMGESDLLSELKSGTKNIRKKQDLSLVRELKDADVSPKELEEELSNLLTILGGKKDN
ncbi:hypothetical protein [Methanocalculus sp. MC3]